MRQPGATTVDPTNRYRLGIGSRPFRGGNALGMGKKKLTAGASSQLLVPLTHAMVHESQQTTMGLFNITQEERTSQT
jgi:hypothetical protein